jgi:hypothetical protein
VAGALAVAAGTALAVSAVLPASHQPSHPGHTQLAAWTVVKQADGGIRVAIHELRDPARLQRTLRADGVPVSVTFTGKSNPACQPYGFSGSPSQHRHLLDSMVTALPGHGNLRVLVIHPSAFPASAGPCYRRPPPRPVPARRRRRANDRPPGEGQPAVHRQLTCLPVTRQLCP